MNSADIHLLKELKLPDRFESLSSLLGPHVARVLVSPDSSVMDALHTAALSIKSRNEGLFVPMVGGSGAGKTTLASNLEHFSASDFTTSIQYTGDVKYADLLEETQQFINTLAANNNKIIPINIDHREGSPPSSIEISEIKRFLRAPSPGARCIVFWPETNQNNANEIAKAYTEITGDAAISLPLIAKGPSPTAWPSIVKTTLEIANNINSLSDLGVDPDTYDPNQFATIGQFMRKISIDFNQNLQRLIASTQVPLTLVITFASESGDGGVLEKLCNSSRLGLLDASALVAATPNSVIGKWWNERKGILVQTILQLNAHAFALGPTSSITALRQHGDSDLKLDFQKMGLTAPGPKLLQQSFGRSNLGKFITGTLTSSTEDRGTPGDTSLTAFKLIAEKGFTNGADKKLNHSMKEAITTFMNLEGVICLESKSEETLGFCPIIPDNHFLIESNDGQKSILCIEYTWRKEEFLNSHHKSEVAQYILEKLKNYSRELGWITE